MILFRWRFVRWHIDRSRVTAMPPGPAQYALAETINGLYKAEVIHRSGPWKSLEAVEFATPEWVDWFNHRRLLEPIGNIPPAEAERRYFAMLDEWKHAA
jgi:putative transposase